MLRLQVRVTDHVRRTGSELRETTWHSVLGEPRMADGDTLLQALRWCYRGLAPRPSSAPEIIQR
jgi:hypothetical protein